MNLWLTVLLLLVAPVLSAREVAGTQWNVRIQWAASETERQRVERWLFAQLDAVASLGTGFVPSTVRLEVHRRHADQPVPWAEIDRGAPTTVRFFIDPRFSDAELDADWTASHEFAHLLIPFPGNRDIWFAEGLASYYQYVARARAGLITERDAWQGLLDGFARGRMDRRYAHLGLAALSPRMWSTNSYYRVYWSGAAYFLQADLRLRRQTQGQWSLERVLAHWQCSCHGRQRWSARALAQAFDAIAGVAVFEPLRREWLVSRHVPDLETTLRYLGVDDSGPLTLDPLAPGAQWRGAIMNGSGGATAPPCVPCKTAGFSAAQPGSAYQSPERRLP